MNEKQIKQQIKELKLKISEPQLSFGEQKELRQKLNTLQKLLNWITGGK